MADDSQLARMASDKARNPVAFPRLNREQLEALCPYYDSDEPRQVAAGTTLFHAGDRDLAMLVLQSGRVNIIDPSGDEETLVATAEAGEFIGDVAMLTGIASVVSAVAHTDCELYSISPDRLHRLLNDDSDVSNIILKAFMARRARHQELGTAGLRVIGGQFSPETHQLREFLGRNLVMFSWLDENDPEAKRVLEKAGCADVELPVVAFGDEWFLSRPTVCDLGIRLGLRQDFKPEAYDLAIVGAGPAGLAAAVYAASEGLDAVVLEAYAPGGQAGSSSKIENYLGFPTGITGAELANNATMQARRFGAHLSTPASAESLERDGNEYLLGLEGGDRVRARCVLIATGAEYRRLPVEGREKFDGAGIYYSAGPDQAGFTADSEVVVVGAANSAGQAAMFLSRTAAKVWILVRGEGLETGMSDYLSHRCEQNPQIEILTHTEICALHGDETGAHLAAIDIRNTQTGEERRIETSAVFTFIGSTPRSGWLPDAVLRDDKGFVLTGADVADSGHWTLERPPYEMETSLPGVFAAGDVRKGSSARVASAVGEGSRVVHYVHRVLGFV